MAYMIFIARDFEFIPISLNHEQSPSRSVASRVFKINISDGILSEMAIGLDMLLTYYHFHLGSIGIPGLQTTTCNEQYKLSISLNHKCDIYSIRN
jgi:hypothetical protein